MPALDLLPISDEELLSRLSESRRELLNLRFQLATGQLDNSARIGQVRREVARILTVLREREIAEAEGRTIAPAPPPRPRRARREDREIPAEVAQAEEAPAEETPAEAAEEVPAIEDVDVEEEA